MLLCQHDTIGYVLDDDTGALLVVEVGVGAIGWVILGEVLRMEHLPDVMVQCACTDELSICTHLRRCCGSEDRDLVGVLEGTRCNLR